MKPALALLLLAACTQCASPTPPTLQMPPRDPTAGTPSAPSVNEDPTRSQPPVMPPGARPPSGRPDEGVGRPRADRKPGGAGRQGQPCPEDGECGSGMTCVHYYGVAGP